MLRKKEQRSGYSTTLKETIEPVTKDMCVYVYYFSPWTGISHREIALELASLHARRRFRIESIVVNEFGKPRIVPAADGIGVPYFNVSHTDSLSMIAVSSTVEVGIDVEPVRPGRDYHAMAKYSFTSGECDVVANSESSAESFVRIWTRKEALIKCVGGSAALLLDRFAVSTSLARIESTAMIPSPEEGVSVAIRYRDLPAGKRYRATVAWRDTGKDMNIVYRRLRSEVVSSQPMSRSKTRYVL
jgi:hypothetical protein